MVKWIGTLVRSAVGFGIDAVIALDGTADPWGAKAVRASAGAVFRLPIVRIDARDVLGLFDRLDARLLIADPTGKDIDAIEIGTSGYALVLGNEGAGPRPPVREAADEIVRVPMADAVESLNVGVAGSLLLYVLAARSSGGS